MILLFPRQTTLHQDKRNAQLRHLPENTQMIYLLFVEVNSVVMHTTSITTTSRMLSVLAC